MPRLNFNAPIPRASGAIFLQNDVEISVILAAYVSCLVASLRPHRESEFLHDQQTSEGTAIKAYSDHIDNWIELGVIATISHGRLLHLAMGLVTMGVLGD